MFARVGGREWQIDIKCGPAVGTSMATAILTTEGDTRRWRLLDAVSWVRRCVIHNYGVCRTLDGVRCTVATGELIIQILIIIISIDSLI